MEKEMSTILKYFSMKYEGHFHDIMEALTVREQMDEDKASKLLPNIKHKAVTIVDNNYPDAFKAMDNPPIVLFYEGNLSLFDQTDFVGRSTDDGVRMFSTVWPDITKPQMTFDYVLACENHEDMDMLLDQFKNKGVQLKDYNMQKENIR